jgi:hypothetical protein
VTRVRHILAKAPATTRRVRAYAFQSKEPPAEVQLWNVGDNPTDYGIHKWTERSQQEVVARYNERGNPLLIDVEHNGATVDGEPAVTGGYARLELREGAPWLVFDWSAVAVEQIATRQRLFLSPEYDVDADTNEITKLYRVSLVADPGTYRARVLATAAINDTRGKGNMDPTVAAILALLDSVPDPAAAVDAVRGFVANLPGDAAAVDEPVVDPVVADAPGAAPKDKPAFAAAGDDKDKKPVAAAAKPVQDAATPVAPPQPANPPVSAAAIAPESDAVKAAQAYALQSENALRDSILMRDGHRLAPSVRQWASSQPLAVVRGLCSAAPEAVAPPSRVTATRGATLGTAAVGESRGLEGEALDELRRKMGTYKASAPQTPHMNDRGYFVLPTITPTEHRQLQAAAAAKGGK